MRILLAYTSGLPNRNDPYISLVPTGLGYIHACLRESGYDSVLANFSGCSSARIKKTLLSLKPEIIGISQWTHNRHYSLDLASKCRRLFPSSIILMGGGHATFCYDELLAEGSPLDCVVIGEGEQTMLELAGRLAAGKCWQDIQGIALRLHGKVMTTSARAPLSNLDMLPVPSRHFEHTVGLDMNLQPEFVVTARGCPSICRFCSSPAFWGRKVRFRSASSIADEIMFIRNRFGVIYFSIRDDTFTADRSRVLELCATLMERRAYIIWNCQSRVTAIDRELLIMMKRAGCECIQLGVESGSPRILKQLGKNITPGDVGRVAGMIREVGISLSIYLIGDVPGETEEDLRLTAELIKRIQSDDGYVSPLAYYPGTRLFEDAVASGAADRNVFSSTEGNAIYVAGSKNGSSGKLLKLLAGAMGRGAPGFSSQKKLLGYCYTTNVVAGEHYRQDGDNISAEREFKEITVKEPDNPWGWFLLGELYSETGSPGKARVCYGKVLELVPMHERSRSAIPA